jgi:selenocysteine-specific elongation factor
MSSLIYLLIKVFSKESKQVISSLFYLFFIFNSYGVIIKLNRIKHYKGNIETNSKFHVSIGHETVIGKIESFGDYDDDLESNLKSGLNLNSEFNFNKEYVFVNDIDSSNKNDDKIKNYYLLVDFTDQINEQSVLFTPNALVVGSKLDTDIHLNQCRIDFYGHVLHSFANKDFYVNGELTKLKVYKKKSKEGVIERLSDSAIGRSLFKKETNIDLFLNLKVEWSTGEIRLIEGKLVSMFTL